MGFSYSKAMLLRPKKEKWLSSFLLVLFISAAVLLPYGIYYPEYFTNAAHTGIKQLATFFVAPQSLGNYYFPIVGSLGMIIGTPIALAAQIIPESVLPYICCGVIALRIALSALTSYAFIRRFTRLPQAACAGSLLYAFSSAVIGISVNNAYQNAIVIFPLVLLAAERLLAENKRILLAVSVIAAIIVSGYATYSILCFLIIYIILRVTSKDIKTDFLRIFAAFFEIVSGILAAAVLFIPIAYICVLNTFTFSDFTGLEAIFYSGGEMYLNIIRSILLPAESVTDPVVYGKALQNSAIYGLYIPLISVSGVIAFCGAKKYSSLKRISILSVIITAIPVLNRIFSVLNPAAGYSWVYMPTLIFALVSVMAIENREINLSGGIKWSLFLTVILSAVILFYPQYTENGLILGLYNDAENKANFIRFLIYALSAIFGIIIFAVILKSAEVRGKSFFNVLSGAVAVSGAVLLWLNVATETAFYKNSLFSESMKTNSDYLLLNGNYPVKVMHYSTVVTVIGLGLLIIYAIICASTAKKRRETECIYPEGDALLEIWQKYDQDDADEYSDFEESFTLDSIADSLQTEYPVNINKDEFKGGFNIVANISEESNVNSIDNNK